MSTVVILNPVAASGRAGKRVASVREILNGWPAAGDSGSDRQSRDDVRVELTNGPGHATDLARTAAASSVDLVVAIGGDGTAHEVVNGLLGAESQDAPTLAHVPMGTGCDFARGLGLSPDPLDNLRRLPQGYEMLVDVGVADLSTDHGRITKYFLNAANIGLGPTVAERVASSRLLGAMGAPAYVIASALELLRPQLVELSLAADEGDAHSAAVLNLSVCNGPFFGGGMRPCPDADLRSGLLAIACIGSMPTFEALRQLPRLMKGTGTDHPAVTYLECAELSLEGEAVAVELDGEIPGRLPGRLRVLPGGLRLRMPK